ncbi:MAG: hypothetical protein WC506_03465 [Candidatus Micrarchaeia archaeon]
MARKSFVFSVLVLALLAGIAYPLKMIAPQAIELSQGATIDAGTIGPGQTMAVSVDPRVSTGGKFGIGGVYDQLEFYSAPEGWGAKSSKITSNPLQAEFTVAPDAQEGEYTLYAHALDEGQGEGLPTIGFKVKVHVTRDVLSVGMSPKSQTVSAGQPARFEITINNKADTNDVYTITSQGVRGWEFKRDIFVPAMSSKTVEYEVVGYDESEYDINITAVSTSSPLISQSENLKFTVHSNLLSDLKATNNGVMIFPVMLSPLYSLAGLLANLY